MNALPLDRNRTPNAGLDALIADYGLRRVFLALVGRIFARTRPPDAVELRLEDQPGLSHLGDRERADIGLPPNPRRDIQIDLIMLNRRDFL